MSLIYKKEYPQYKFDLYFFGYRHGRGEVSREEGLKGEGGVGLLYNYGTEKDEKFAYHNGNNEPQGFGVGLIGWVYFMKVWLILL